MITVNKLVHVGSGIIMDDAGRLICDLSTKMATFVAEPIADEIVKRYNHVPEEVMVKERKPIAWMWYQLRYDSMGGWERQLETHKPDAGTCESDIKDLVPLYGD